MRKIALIILLCNISALFFRAEAQQSAMLIGKVSDADSKLPIEFATIALLASADSALITGATSDPEGNFKVDAIPFGTYLVQINFLGYEARYFGPLEFSAASPLQRLSEASLKAASTIAAEVEVSAEKNQLQLGLDRKIFNVEKSLLAQGGTATDVLRNTPTLDVDQDGNIKLRGNQGVTVLINGKPSALTGSSRKAILDQIPANMVKSVEIITNPSAKYDPDGISGIINIVLKKNTLEGFSSNVAYSIGTLGNKHNATLGFNYRNKKINFFSNYNFNSNNLWESGSNFRQNIMPDSSYYMNQNTFGEHLTEGHFIKAGLDYFINDKNTISFAASLTPQTWHNFDTINYEWADESELISRRYRRDAEELNRGLTMEYNFNYSHNFKAPEQKLSFDATFSNYDGKGQSDYMEQDHDAEGNPIGTDAFLQQNKNFDKNRILTAQADYTHPLKKIGGRLEMGTKGTLRDVDNDLQGNFWDMPSASWQNNAGLSNHFRYREQVYAAYSTFGQKIKKFSYQAGLRLEQALTRSELLNTDSVYNYNYFSFFPSAHVGYELPKQQQIQFAYSRRINRPDLMMLNPFISYTDPMNVHQGNPYLRPEFIHSLELSHAKYWDKATLSSTLYYRQTSNVFRRMFLVDAESGVGKVQYLNFKSTQSYGVEMVASYRPYKWWNMNASFNVYTMQEDGSNIGAYSNFAVWGHGSWSTAFTLPKGFSVQGSIFYRSALKLVIGELKDMWVMNFAFSKTLFKGQGTVSVRIQDPFRLQRFDIFLSDYNYSNDGRYRWESQIAYLSFNYNFGKMDMQTRSRMRNNGGGQQRGGSGVM